MANQWEGGITEQETSSGAVTVQEPGKLNEGDSSSALGRGGDLRDAGAEQALMVTEWIQHVRYTPILFSS